jgi:hypothetical protein
MGNTEGKAQNEPLHMALQALNSKHINLGDIGKLTELIKGKEPQIQFLLSHLLGDEKKIFEALHKLPDEFKEMITVALPPLLSWISEGHITPEQIAVAGPHLTIARLLRFLKSKKRTVAAKLKFVQKFKTKEAKRKEL